LMNKPGKISRRLWWLVPVFVLLSCADETKKLDKTTRQVVESMARTEMIRLDDSLKVVCDSLYTETFERVKDSLYAARQEEIQQILLEE
jgi:hypothetical protein